MSRFISFEYQIPQFTRPEGYDENAFIEDAVRYGYTGAEQRLSSWYRMARKHPWLYGMTDFNPVGEIAAIVAEEAEVNNVFRPRTDIWHVDTPQFGNRLSLLRTSTPTLFASCVLHIDESAYSEWANIANPAISSGPLFKNFGKGWLEAAASEECDPLLRLLVPKVEDLAIVQAIPGVIASGNALETLHCGAVRHPSQPNLSVIARAMYSE